MTPKTDDPEIVLAALQLVEAVMIDEREKLEAALQAARAHPLAVLLSLAALTSEILQTAPNGPAKLQEWLLATQVETATPDLDELDDIDNSIDDDSDTPEESA